MGEAMSRFSDRLLHNITQVSNLLQLILPPFPDVISSLFNLQHQHQTHDSGNLSNSPLKSLKSSAIVTLPLSLSATPQPAPSGISGLLHPLTCYTSTTIALRIAGTITAATRCGSWCGSPDGTTIPSSYPEGCSGGRGW
jgi:hypothetical protein